VRGDVRGWVVVALVLTTLAGCGGGSDREPRPEAAPGTPAQRVEGARVEPTPAVQIGSLLRERAAALEAGNVAAYAATGVGAQRARDRRAARRAGRLELRDVELVPVSVDVDGRRATIRVDARFEYAGVRSTFHSQRRVTAVRVGGRWRVRAVRGERGLPPWEIAPFTERRSRHFVVLSPPGVPAEQLVPDLENGYARMRDLLSRARLRRRYLVVVAGDAAQTRALTETIRGVETLTAISDASIRERGVEQRVTDVESVRLLVVWPAFSTLDPDGRQRVVTHELTHAALAGSTSGRTPAWLVEGVALYVSGDRRFAPPGADLGALSRPDAIGRLTGAGQASAYAVSSAAAFAIAERFGRRRLLALYDAFNDPRLVGRPGRRLTNRALRRELGITLSDVLS
jgi:hypothetical protein